MDSPTVHCPECGEFRGSVGGRHFILCPSMRKSMDDVINLGGGTDFPIRYSIQNIAPKHRNKKGIVTILTDMGYSEISKNDIVITEKGKIWQKSSNDSVYGPEKEFLGLVKEYKPKYLEITDGEGKIYFLQYAPPETQSGHRLRKLVSSFIPFRKK